jgi:hypothetical protein
MINRVKTNMEFAKSKLEKEKICIIYTGNVYIDKDSELIHVIEDLKDLNQIYLVGEHINYDIFKDLKITDEITIMDNSSLYLLSLKKSIDLMIIYKDLSLFFDNNLNNINSKNKILWQYDSKFKVYGVNGITIDINNPNRLTNIMNKIDKIICEEKVKQKLDKNYLINNDKYFTTENTEIVPILNENLKSKHIEIEKIGDKFGINLVSNINFPPFLKNILSKYILDDWDKMVVNNSLQKIVKILQNEPEPLFHLLKFAEKIGNNDLVKKYLDKLEQICNNDNYKYFKNILEIYNKNILI